MSAEKARDERVVDTIFEKIDRLVEVDYGDFKRKASHYLLRLQDSFAGKADAAAIRQTIEQLKMDVVYSPKQDVESAREKLLSGLQKIKKLVN